MTPKPPGSPNRGKKPLQDFLHRPTGAHGAPQLQNEICKFLRWPLEKTTVALKHKTPRDCKEPHPGHEEIPNPSKKGLQFLQAIFPQHLGPHGPPPLRSNTQIVKSCVCPWITMQSLFNTNLSSFPGTQGGRGTILGPSKLELLNYWF